jgi:hypothetical protein
MAATNSPAFDKDALLGKSRVFVNRGLTAKREGRLDEYQLWASFALELLGKAALASVHPCLVADPTHVDSLFVAAGRPVSADPRSIMAKTVFERVPHVAKRFDNQVREFCLKLAMRRNSELHSGEAPLALMELNAWEGDFWNACDVLLDPLQLSLDEWLDEYELEVPADLLAHFQTRIAEKAKRKCAEVGASFVGRFNEAERNAMVARSHAAFMPPERFRFQFSYEAEETWSAKCPACGGRGFICGSLWEESVGDTQYDEDSAFELVEKTFLAEEYGCPTCGLRLRGRASLDAVGLPLEHLSQEAREAEYPEEYGNE